MRGERRAERGEREERTGGGREGGGGGRAEEGGDDMVSGRTADTGKKGQKKGVYVSKKVVR